MKIHKNYSLKKLNSYQLNVKAKYFFEVKNKSDLVNIFNWVLENKIGNFFILGGGSNVIFKNDFYGGLVIKISNRQTSWLNRNKVKVGAGRGLNSFLATCQKKQFYDIQSLAGIPGTVGAGTFGNVGAFGQEIRKFVSLVEVFDIKKREFKFMESKDLNFSYRNSFLKQNRNKYIIFSVIFDLSSKFYKNNSVKDEYFSLKDFARKHNIKKLNKEDIRKNILKIRKGIYPDIEKYPNVGSTFKNIEVSKNQFKNIKKKYPDIPNWELENGEIKIPTAYIFDKVLALNGKVFGNIKIDEKRPLFFVNRGRATGKEFYNLCQKIKREVKKKLNIKIEEEVFFVK